MRQPKTCRKTTHLEYGQGLNREGMVNDASVHKAPPGELAEEETLKVVSRDGHMKIMLCHEVRGRGAGTLVVSATLLCFIELFSPDGTRLGLAAGGIGGSGLLGSEVEDRADADIPKEDLFIFKCTLVYSVSSVKVPKGVDTSETWATQAASRSERRIKRT